MADQDGGRLPGLAQMIGRADEVGDVGRERRIGEVAFAGAEAGEVEPEHRDAMRRQCHRDASRRMRVLAAGEAMREQRIGARHAVGEIERGGQSVAACAFELETFGRHDVIPHRCVRARH
ncbi:hypothetical protein ACVIJ6_007250 [Bradyrhizobium sp. USDA 4369]